MPRAQDLLIAEFTRWDRGWAGRLGRDTPVGAWDGVNLQVLKNGAVTPRSAMFDLGVTGVSSGRVWGFGVYPQSTKAWYLQEDGSGNTKFWWFDYSSKGNPAQTSGAGLSTGVVPTQTIDYASYRRDRQMLTVYGDKLYYIDSDVNSISPLTPAWGSGGACIAHYGDRLVVGNVPGYPGRIYYSQAADYPNWPATNFIDVGRVQIGITNLVALRDMLVIRKADGGLYVLTGVPGVNDTLRPIVSPDTMIGVGSGTGPGTLGWGKRHSRTHAGLVVGFPEWGPIPELFDGARIEHLAHLDPIIDPPDITSGVSRTYDWYYGYVGPLQADPKFAVAPVRELPEVAMLARSDLLLYRNGTWTRHTFDQNAVGYWQGYFMAAAQFGGLLFCNGGSLQFTHEGGYSDGLKFFFWHAAQEAIPVEGDAEMFPTSHAPAVEVRDDVLVNSGGWSWGKAAPEASLRTWGVEASRGEEMIPRRVEVLFDRVDPQIGGSADNSHFDVSIVYEDVPGADSLEATAITYDEASPGPVNDPVQSRRSFSFQPVSCRRFSVHVKNIRNCAIHKIEVYGQRPAGRAT